MDNEHAFGSRIDLSDLHDSVKMVKEEVGKVIVGQEQMINLMLTAILSDGHVLLEGVPGVAKTLAAKLLAQTVDAQFSRVQFTPDLMPSDVLGTSIYNLKSNEFEFKAGPDFANIILIDEINRAPAKTQAALFEVMEERQITMDGTTYPMDFPYLVVATQNPIEQEGTYRLPEAQLDRFLFKVKVEYPTVDEEVAILERHHGGLAADFLTGVNKVLTKENVRSYREKVQGLHVDPQLLSYIAQLVHATRQDESLYLGASPRASVALLNGAKAFAAIQGRDFITPEDIHYIAHPVLGHRIILTPEKEMEGVSTSVVVKEIIDKVEVPR